MLVLSRIYQLSDRLSRRIHPTTLEVVDFYAIFVKSKTPINNMNPHREQAYVKPLNDESGLARPTPEKKAIT